jgi:hypothetical protein
MELKTRMNIKSVPDDHEGDWQLWTGAIGNCGLEQLAIVDWGD